MACSLRLLAVFALLLVCCSLMSAAFEDVVDGDVELIRAKRQWGWGGRGWGGGWGRGWGGGWGRGMYGGWGGRGMYGGYGWGR